MPNESILSVIVLGEALQTFSSIIAPISAMAYTYEDASFNLGDTVKVPYCPPNTDSSAFSYATGYGNGNNTSLGVKSVTLDKLLFQKFTINDCDAGKLNAQAIYKFGQQAAAKLAGDVISASMASVITDVNYLTSASCTSNQLTSSIALADLGTQADNTNWPTENRNLILGTSAWNSMLRNPALNTAYAYGGSSVVQEGMPAKIFGFNPYKTNVTLPNNCKGLVLQPTSLLFVSGQHKPSTQADTVVTYDSMTQGGVTLSLKSWYAPLQAQTVYVFEVLCGATVGNPAGLFQLK